MDLMVARSSALNRRSTPARPLPLGGRFTHRPRREIPTMSKARIATFAAASITAVPLLTGCSSTPSGTESSGSSSVPSAEVSAEANAADEMFATMMIVHHEQAIEMSDVILAKNSVDPAVTELAQKIKDAQGPEIDRMNDWLKAWSVRPRHGRDGPRRWHGRHDVRGGHGGAGSRRRPNRVEAVP